MVEIANPRPNGEKKHISATPARVTYGMLRKQIENNKKQQKLRRQREFEQYYKTFSPISLTGNLGNILKIRDIYKYSKMSDLFKKVVKYVVAPVLIGTALIFGGCTDSVTPVIPEPTNESPKISKFYLTDFHVGIPLNGTYSVSDKENDNYSGYLTHSIKSKSGALSSVDVYTEEVTPIVGHAYTNNNLSTEGNASLEIEVKDTVNNNSTTKHYDFPIDRNGHKLIVTYDTDQELEFTLDAAMANTIGAGMAGGSSNYEDTDYDTTSDGFNYGTESSTEKNNVETILNDLLNVGTFDNLQLYNNPSDFSDKKTLLEDILTNNRANVYEINVNDYTDI